VGRARKNRLYLRTRKQWKEDAGLLVMAWWDMQLGSFPNLVGLMDKADFRAAHGVLRTENGKRQTELKEQAVLDLHFKNSSRREI
jgi:hypothetical protein